MIYRKGLALSVAQRFGATLGTGNGLRGGRAIFATGASV
jgi:hypothetical protein